MKIENSEYYRSFHPRTSPAQRDGTGFRTTRKPRTTTGCIRGKRERNPVIEWNHALVRGAPCGAPYFQFYIEKSPAFDTLCILFRRSSVVERLPVKEMVAGPNPAAGATVQQCCIEGKFVIIGFNSGCFINYR